MWKVMLPAESNELNAVVRMNLVMKKKLQLKFGTKFLVKKINGILLVDMTRPVVK
jgi:hypothetical protein